MALFDDYEGTSGGGGGLLGRIFGGGGGGGGTLDLYGDLFTPEQKAALQQREMTQGLFRMAEKLGALAQPTRAPPGLGGILGSLGAGLGAYGGGTGEETALKGMQTAELVRASQQKRALNAKIGPVLTYMLEHNIDPKSTLGQQFLAKAGAPDMAAAAAPAAPGVPPPTAAAPPLPDVGAAGEYGVGQGPSALPPTPQPDVKLQNTGLLPPPPGAPDQLVGPDGQPLPQGVLPNMLASLTGGTPGGPLPFRLASAAIPNGPNGPRGGAGAAGSDTGGRQARIKFWTDQGAPPHVAEGIADRVGVESSYRPDAIGDGGTSGGLYQHHADRLARLKNFAAQQNLPWTDPNVQDQFAATEVKGGDPIAAKGWQEILAAPDRQTAATLWDRYFERSAGGPGAAAAGYRRGGRFAGAGPDAGRIPIGGGAGGGELQALSALMRLTGGGGGEGEEDPLATLASMTSGGGPPDTVLRPGGGADLPIQQATAALAPYATGNARLGQPSSVAGVGADMSGRIERMVQAMPQDVRERFLIISGFRDAEQQARVNPRVTNSRHMHGAAVDLTKDPVVLDWITKNPQYGLGFPLASDPKEINHLEMIDPATGGRLPIMRAQYSPGGATAPTTGGAAAPAGGGGYIPGLGITPQGLAALNALTEMGGLGDPFKSLLETYYKSPGYLGEAATATKRAEAAVQLETGPQIKRAETLADLQAQIELKPKLEAAIEQAKIDPKLSYDERKALIDRETERLKQVMTMMGTSREVVLTPPGGQARKLTLTNEQILRVSQGKPLPEIGLPAMTAIQLGEPVLSPEQTAAQTKRGEAPYTAGDLTLTWPDGETRKVQVTGEQRKDVLEGRPVPALGWPGTVGGAPGQAGSPGGTGARVGERVYTPGQEAEQKGAAESRVKLVQGYREQADLSADAKTTLQGISAEIGNMVHGPFAPAAQLASSYLRILSPGYDKQVSSYEELYSNANELVRKAVRQSDPNPSFIQTQMAMDAMPVPSRSPEGLAKITNRMIGVNDHNIARAAAIPYYQANIGKGSVEGFDSWWRKSVSPYAFVFSKMSPDDQAALVSRLNTTGQGQREVEKLKTQLGFIKQNGLEQ